MTAREPGTERSPLRALPGTYALLLRARAPWREIEIGRLGRLVLRPGHYVYVGSAFGPGGVRARVGRHLRVSKPPHWHLDYLRSSVIVDEVWCSYDARRHEHRWADSFSRGRRVRVPLPGFGASDCDCASHLFHQPRPPVLAGFLRRLRSDDPGHGRVHRWVL